MMKTTALGLILVLAACGGRDAAGPGAEERGLEAMAKGDLDRAELLLRGATGVSAKHLLARLHLLRRRDREALELLVPLVTGRVADFNDLAQRQQATLDLLSAQLRLDDFNGAARTTRLLNDPVLTRKYELLGRGVAYAGPGNPEETAVDFVQTHPAPVLSARVNGREGLFLLDTQQDELVLDRDFARRAGLEAGEEGVVKEFALGRWTLRQVPVHVSPLKRLGAHEIAGAIGLSLLMHHDFTIDFRRSRLTLRRPGSETPPGGLPLLWAGERNLLLGGTANGSATVFVGIGSALQNVTLAASDFHLQQLGGRLVALQLGTVRLALPAVETAAFPSNLDASFGIPAAFVLGNAGLKGRSLRVDPRSMQAWLD